MKRTIALILMLIISTSLLAGCGEKTPDILGKWYDSDGKYLSIREDGSYKLEGDYGTGTWKFLDDNLTVEFTDFYGDTKESLINTNELGEYISLGSYGDFYRNSYPTIDDITIDVFENVTIDTDGASPFCTVTYNTDNCSDFLKEYISYDIVNSDSNYYKIGDTVTISANMYGELASQNTPKTKELTIDNIPEYIDNVDDLDTDKLNHIIEEHLESEMNAHEVYYTSDLFSSSLFDNTEFISHDIIEYGLITRNPDSLDNFDPRNYAYNTYYCLYEFEIANHNNNTTSHYIVEVLLTNICKTPDGSFKWNVLLIDAIENDIKGGCYDSVSSWARYGRYYDYYYSDIYDVEVIYYNETFDGTKFSQ